MLRSLKNAKKLSENDREINRTIRGANFSRFTNDISLLMTPRCAEFHEDAARSISERIESVRQHLQECRSLTADSEAIAEILSKHIAYVEDLLAKASGLIHAEVTEEAEASVESAEKQEESTLRVTNDENSAYDASVTFTQGTLTIVRHIGKDYDEYEISRTDEEVAAIYLISGIEAEGVDPECRDMLGFVTTPTEDKLPEQMMLKDGWEGRDRLVDVRPLPVGSWAFSAVIPDLLDAHSQGKPLITCRVESGDILIAD